MCIVIKYFEINAVLTLFVFPVRYDLRIPVFFFTWCFANLDKLCSKVLHIYGMTAMTYFMLI